MATKKVNIKIEVNSVESLINSFAMWRDTPHEKRAKFIAQNGGDKRFTVKLAEPKKDGAYSVSFYSDGAVYVTFGKFHSIKMLSGSDPLNIYTKKSGESKAYPLTRSDCTDYYSMENKALVGALSGSF